MEVLSFFNSLLKIILFFSPCTHTFVYEVFSKPFESRFIHHDLLFLNTLPIYFLRAKMFSYIIFCSVINSRNLTSMQYSSYSNFVTCPNSKYFSDPLPLGQASHSAFSYHISFISFNLQQFFSLSLSFMKLTFFSKYRPGFLLSLLF